MWLNSTLLIPGWIEIFFKVAIKVFLVGNKNSLDNSLYPLPLCFKSDSAITLSCLVNRFPFGFFFRFLIWQLKKLVAIGLSPAFAKYSYFDELLANINLFLKDNFRNLHNANLLRIIVNSWYKRFLRGLQIFGTFIYSENKI